MNAPAEAFEKTVSYIRICGGGMVVIICYNLIGSLFRGIGDSKTPLMTVAIASVFNTFGDLLLVAFFHQGAAGAALATVAAQTLSVVISYAIIKKRGLPFPFSLSMVRLHGATAPPYRETGSPHRPAGPAGGAVIPPHHVHRKPHRPHGVCFHRGVGKNLRLHHAHSRLLHAVHERLRRPERGSPAVRPGGESPFLRHRHGPGRGGMHVHHFLLLRHPPHRPLHLRRGGGTGSGGLSQGLRHRLPPHVGSLLIHRFLQWPRHDEVRHGPGYCGSLLRTGTGVLPHEPGSTAPALPYRSRHAGIFGSTDPALCDRFSVCEGEKQELRFE